MYTWRMCLKATIASTLLAVCLRVPLPRIGSAVWLAVWNWSAGACTRQGLRACFPIFRQAETVVMIFVPISWRPRYVDLRLVSIKMWYIFLWNECVMEKEESRKVKSRSDQLYIPSEMGMHFCGPWWRTGVRYFIFLDLPFSYLKFIQTHRLRWGFKQMWPSPSWPRVRL